MIHLSGSLAFDRIMTFPGRFEDHILPEKLHFLNVCFPIDHVEEKRGGTAGNIICDKVSIKGTLRTANSEIRAMMTRRIHEVAEGIALSMGCTADVDITPGYAALVNDANEAARIRRVAARLFGEENSVEKPEPSMGGEDFSFFGDCAPGAFFHIGCTPAGKLPAPALHSKDFYLDEECLTIGTLMHVALVFDR